MTNPRGNTEVNFGVIVTKISPMNESSKIHNKISQYQVGICQVHTQYRKHSSKTDLVSNITADSNLSHSPLVAIVSYTFPHKHHVLSLSSVDIQSIDMRPIHMEPEGQTVAHTTVGR